MRKTDFGKCECRPSRLWKERQMKRRLLHRQVEAGFCAPS